jgi:hypothetical protein
MASSKTPLDMAVLPTAVAVCSESDPDTVYQVQLPYCPCPDFRWRRANAGALASVDPQRLFCKHLVTALDRVAGWHRKPEPLKFENITDVEAKALLRGSMIRMSARESNALMTRADKAADGRAEFEASLIGAIVDGEITMSRLHGTVTIILFPDGRD